MRTIKLLSAILLFNCISLLPGCMLDETIDVSTPHYVYYNGGWGYWSQGYWYGDRYYQPPRIRVYPPRPYYQPHYNNGWRHR